MAKKIKVLVCDDSALIRQIITRGLEKFDDIEVVATAVDPFDAREKIKLHKPDVLTLDIEMPRMNGLEFLEKIMRLRPMPVIMVSTLTQKGADATIAALELGAFDFLGKPDGASQDLAELAPALASKIRIASKTRIRPRAAAQDDENHHHRLTVPAGYRSHSRFVVLGASTGGVEAIRDVLLEMPADSPPMIITQHMPPGFTASFAQRLNDRCAINVVEAKDGIEVRPGMAVIAQGDRHLRLLRHNDSYIIKNIDEPEMTGHRPSVDHMMLSAAELLGKRGVGIILTGMGKDGALGLKAMRNHGAPTIGQDEESSVVYGMPRAAYLNDAVQFQIPLKSIARKILDLCV